jgi:hypothetical protein
MIIIVVVLVVLLAIVYWQLAPRLKRVLWDWKGQEVDPTGNLVPEDQAFKKPPNEGDRL